MIESRQLNASQDLSWRDYLLSGMFILLILCFTIRVEQADFHWLLPIFIAAFAGFSWLLFQEPSGRRLSFWLLMAVLFRVLLIPFLPNLSDDFYRFIWDGHLVLSGINPLDRLPSDWIAISELDRPAGLTSALYAELNSPEYFTVYPPINQMVFSFSVWLFPDSVLGAVGVMKSVFLIAEICSFLILWSLLKRWDWPEHRVLWYALNPLILFETFHNLHFEILMILFMLMGLQMLVLKRQFLSGFLMGLGVATKILPLMLFPFLVRRLWWRSFFIWGFGLSAALALLFVPFLLGSYENLSTSLSLYFQHFEFNGGLYYVFRWIGYQFTGFNLINFVGPGLAIVACLLILFLAAKEKPLFSKRLPVMWLWAFTIFLLSTTTLHPWYLSFIIAMSALSGIRFPLVWSFLILLTYINYSYSEYQENLWIVGFEYLVLLGFVIWENRRGDERFRFRFT